MVSTWIFFTLVMAIEVKGQKSIYYPTIQDYPNSLYYPVHRSHDWNVSICSFLESSCGYRNQIDSKQFYRIDYWPTLTAYGMMIMALNDTQPNITYPLYGSSGSRFWGKYYETNNKTQGCLIIKSLTYGPGISHWFITQRDQEDRGIYQYLNHQNNWNGHKSLDDYWSLLTLPVNLTNGPVMFFFDIRTTNGNGLMAFDYIVLLYRECVFMQIKMSK